MNAPDSVTPTSKRGIAEVYRDDAGEWRWRVRAGNGEIVIPPEGHRDEHDAARAFTTAATVLASVDKIEILHQAFDTPELPGGDSDPPPG